MNFSVLIPNLGSKDNIKGEFVIVVSGKEIIEEGPNEESIEDLMNKRFGDPNSKDYCPHKIDILVKSSLKYGGTNKGEFAKIYVLNDKSRDSFYRSKMLPEYKGI